jgi:hypothetical protein
MENDDGEFECSTVDNMRSVREVSKWAELRRKVGAELDLVASWVSSGCGLG